MRLAILLLLLLMAVPAFAEPTIVSHAPDSVSVTVYRDPSRSPYDRIDPEGGLLGGYALVTETRSVDLPPGPVTIRFEGVASGIQPESAILAGAQVGEKNRDRRLLSERAMIDAFTGQQVLLRRTDPATGKVTTEPVRVRSGAGGIIVQTATGFEALHCTGLNETILYPGVPAGLSAKPVLSVTTRDQPGGRRTLTLSYLSFNFDWQANYVAELSADADRLDLFAWVTLASGDDTSFERAATNAVAGQVARVPGWQEREPQGDGAGRIYAQCWPSGVTRGGSGGLPPPPPPPPPPPMAMMAPMAEDSIVVTGSRIMVHEQLGDLKLYRIPFPVTVAARSQKQVAFLHKSAVRAELFYRSDVDGGGAGDPRLVIRLQNRKEQGLGEPLPAGRVALFQQGGGERLLLGETATPDKAVGEEVELVFGVSANVSVTEEKTGRPAHGVGHRLSVANANPYPILFEARFPGGGGARFEGFDRHVVRKDGRWIWRVTVPPNATATLAYREVEIENED